MIGVVISSKLEWKTLLEIYNIDDSHLEKYPYGEFYRTIFKNKDVVFFRSGARKVNAAASVQYMIDRFSLEKIITIGTCAAVNDSYNYLDVIIPEKVVDYDSIIRDMTIEIEEDAFIDVPKVNISLDYYDGILGTSDKALVSWKDLTYLASNGIDASDMESSAVIKVAITNNIDYVIIRGISDRPMKNSDGLDEQIDVYEENTPLVMKKLIEDYLPEVI
ncbi:MAG: 5'-methylthioadenosine/S-adenosylhomocysteine nucleosidase [Bacilli bacterium]|nr:5'-methylthioadenosine/S-adenosylhomocysteine nucleosidase [Bacilli bacterium]